MLSSCHCWTVWCCAQQQMMVGVAAVDEETVQIFGPRTEEAAQRCCPSNKYQCLVLPRVLLSCQICMAPTGSWLVSLVLCVLVPAASLSPPCVGTLNLLSLWCVTCSVPLLWSQAGITVSGAGLVQAQPTGRKVHSFPGAGLCYAVAAEALNFVSIVFRVSNTA